MKVFRVIPSAVILIGVWAILRLRNFDLSVNTAYGIGIVIAGFIVLTIEFFKSGDIGLGAYMADQAFAIISLVMATTVITVVLQRGEHPYLADWIIAGVCLIDAWFSPVNSFRTALRNWAAADSHPTSA